MDPSFFSELNLTNKDSKVLIPALITFLQNFESKFEKMFSEIKEDFQSKIMERDQKVGYLEKEVSLLNEKVLKMEKLADDAEAYERRDTVIFSGPAIPEVTSNENCTSLLQDILKTKLNFNLSQNDINTAHRLGPKPKTQAPDKRSIILKLCRRDVKREIITACKNQSPNQSSRLYANESLTSSRRKVFNTLKSIKRQHPELVRGVSSYEGRVYAYTKNPATVDGPARDRRHLVNDQDMLVKFCRDFIKKPVENFLDSFH